MALSVKVGTFQKRVGAGTTAITGLGFQPKAILFFWSTSSTTGAWSRSTLQAGFGMTAGPTLSRATSVWSIDSAAQGNSTLKRAAAACITNTANGSSADWEAQLSSFDADGFTVNWTTNSVSGFTVNITYIAFGGTDITNATVVDSNRTTSTNVVHAVTGVGFQPDLVFSLTDQVRTVNALPQQGFPAAVGISMMNAEGQQAAFGYYSETAVQPSDVSTWSQSDACIAMPGSSQTVQVTDCFSSMDADGFSMYQQFGSGNDRIFSLCLKGISSKIGSFTKTVAAAPASQSIARCGFAPRAVLLSGINMPLGQGSNIVNPWSGLAWSFGAADGTASQHVQCWVETDNASTTELNAYWNGAALYVEPGTNHQIPSTTTLGVLSSLDTDGFTMSFNPNLTTAATQIFYVAFGDAGFESYPAAVGV